MSLLFLFPERAKMESTKEKFDSLIYTEFEEYMELSPGDKKFFDNLFSVLIYFGEINWSNKKLSEMLGESESTLEKRLSRLERSKLIIREVSKQCDFGKWRTVDRVIRLNPFHFQFDFNTMAHKIFCDYLFHTKTAHILSKYLEMPYDEFIKAYGKVRVVGI